MRDEHGSFNVLLDFEQLAPWSVWLESGCRGLNLASAQLCSVAHAITHDAHNASQLRELNISARDMKLFCPGSHPA